MPMIKRRQYSSPVTVSNERTGMMRRLGKRLAAYAGQGPNAGRPYLFRLSLRCTCTWLPASYATLDLLIAAASLALALLADICLWLYLTVSGASATMDICKTITFYIVLPLPVYVLSVVALTCAFLFGVGPIRLYRLDCKRRFSALGFDVESDDPTGDKLTEACRLLAHPESLRDAENPAEDVGVPFEPNSAEWYQSLTNPVRWSGTFAQDHVDSSYTMRITQIERINGNGVELVRFKGVGADLIDSFVCSGYACRRGGRVRFAWGHTYAELGAQSRYFTFGDGVHGSSCEQRGMLTLDKDNTIALVGRWSIEFIHPSYASPGSLLCGTFALTARCR